MGNQPTGSLYLRTDKGCYYAGETVTGTIYVYLPVPFAGNTLVLKVRGKEETYYVVEVPINDPNQDPNRPREQRYRKEYHSGRNVFYNHRIPVYVWNGAYAQPGQYSFPFAFTLNNFLPGTFALEEEEFRGHIDYELAAELETWEPKKTNPIYNSIPMAIREPLKQAVSTLQGEMTSNLSTWCCVSQGVSHIKCAFERNAYAPGETANILCEVDNSQCKLAVKNLRASLKCRISLQDSAGDHKERTEAVFSRDFDGVAALQSAIGDQRRSYSIPLVNNQTHKAFLPSTNGQLIKCTFTLEVLADMEGCTCCAQHPKVEVPVTIFAPMVTFDLPPPPADWHPQTMQVANLVINDAAMMAASTMAVAAGMAGGMANVQMNVGMNIDKN
jgi:hypothetical protein